MKLMLIFVLTMLKETEINALVKQIFDEIRFTQEPAGLYDPLRYMIEIGGKRIRPRLCLTTYSFYSDTFDESIFSPAAALECAAACRRSGRSGTKTPPSCQVT